MTNDIIRKISDEINKGIDSEAQVLYLLVEIRKVRQARSRVPKSFLDFYRDWTCHVELTHDNAVGKFLDKFEPLVKHNQTAHEIASAFIANFPSFFKLDELKIELRNFLQNESLTTAITNDSIKWSTFAKHLLNILKDCSIKRLGDGGEIKELVLEVNDDGNSQFKFRLIGRRDCPICKLKWK